MLYIRDFHNASFFHSIANVPLAFAIGLGLCLFLFSLLENKRKNFFYNAHQSKLFPVIRD